MLKMDYTFVNNNLKLLSAEPKIGLSYRLAACLLLKVILAYRVWRRMEKNKLQCVGLAIGCLQKWYNELAMILR